MIHRSVNCFLLALLGAGLLPTVMAESVDVESLKEILSQHFPQVSRWEITPVSKFNAKRQPHAFGKNSEVVVLRDGDTFYMKSLSAGSAVKYRVMGMTTVMTVNGFLPAKSELLQQEVERKERDVIAMGCEPVPAGENLGGVRLRRDMRRGDVLCREDMEPRPLVTKGDRVMVHCVQGPVSVSVAAIALGEASRGHRVHLRRSEGQERLVARVTERGEADACS